MSQGLPLDAYIKDLRRSLSQAMDDGENETLKFEMQDLTLELVIGATQSKSANGGIKFEVFGIGFNAGGKVEDGSSATQKLTLKLKPVTQNEDEEWTNALVSGKVNLDLGQGEGN